MAKIISGKQSGFGVLLQGQGILTMSIALGITRQMKRCRRI